MTVSRRPENPDDEPFLRRLIMETVARQLGMEAWPQDLREHLLDIQYRSRRASVKAQFPHGSSHIILVDGEEAGWLFLADLEDQIRIVEIMILVRHRGKGIGSAVIGEALAAASRAGKPVRLGVDAMNENAIRFYRRLGFQQTSGDSIQWQMEHTPQPAQRTECFD